MRTIRYLALLGLVLALLLTGCGRGQPPGRGHQDIDPFTAQYENLNGKKNDWGEEYYHVEIPPETQVTILEYTGLMEMLESGSGMLYIGRPGCPWCRLLLPVLTRFTIDNDIVIYYYDIEAGREAYDDEYQAILEKLDAYLPVDEVTQSPEDEDFNPEKKRVVLPHLFFLRQGEITGDLMAYQHPYLEEGQDEQMYQLLEELWEGCQ